MKRITATPKYLALDVHKATCTYSLRDASGTILERGVVHTCAHHLVALVQSFGRHPHVTFEEGTQAQWRRMSSRKTAPPPRRKRVRRTLGSPSLIVREETKRKRSARPLLARVSRRRAATRDVRS